MNGGKKAPGFTLVELLVATTIFVLAATALGQIFSSFYVLHRKVSNQAVLAQEMRFAMEFLVRQTRTKLIKYPPLPAAVAYTNSIDLVDKDGGITTIALRNGAECQADVPGLQCLALTEDGGTTWYPLTGGRTHVSYFLVNVRPLTDPFEQTPTGYDNNTQPGVTYTLGLTYKAASTKDEISVAAQTSVSQRKYVR